MLEHKSEHVADNEALDIKKNAGISPVPELSQEDKISPIKQNLLGNSESKEKAKKAKKDEVAENMNIRAAIVHLLGDMIQSIGVISAALIIKFKPDWQIADPICTFLFSILVLFTTVPIFLECVHIIMENSPEAIDVHELYNEIARLKTVEEIHDFHCWALAGDKFIMTCHIRSNFGERAVRQINRICKQSQYRVYHTTVQVEKEDRKAEKIKCDHL